MSRIWVLAANTFKEVIRDRVLFILILFAILLMSLSFAIGQLSHEEVYRLSVSLGLASIQMCFSGLVVFLGCSLFAREIDQRTIYTLLVRPIKRWQYLVGKFLGLQGVLVLLLLGFLSSFLVVQVFLGLDVSWQLIVPFFGFFLEGAVLLSITFFFSSFASPFVAIGCSICCFLVGHWIPNLVGLIEKSKNVLFQWVGEAIVFLFPNLENYNWRFVGIERQSIEAQVYINSSLQALIWIGFFLLVTHIIFSNRDFE